jgi:hypothetical protein
MEYARSWRRMHPPLWQKWRHITHYPLPQSLWMYQMGPNTFANGSTCDDSPSSLRLHLFSPTILGKLKCLTSASYHLVWTGERPHSSRKYQLETVYGGMYLNRMEGGSAILLQMARTQKHRRSMGRTAALITKLLEILWDTCRRSWLKDHKIHGKWSRMTWRSSLRRSLQSWE